MWALKGILILFVAFETVHSRIQVPIGAIFDIENKEAKIAFKHAVFRENMYGAKFNLVPTIQVIDATNTYETEQAVCAMLSNGVAAIFESLNSQFKETGIIASICNEYGIPHLTGFWTPEIPDYKRPFRQFTRNFFPSPSAFSRALADLIEDYDWTTFTVIYEDDYGLMRVHDILQYHNSENGPVIVRKISDGDDQLPMLKEIAQYGESRIVLDCSIDKVIPILKQAKKVKLLEEYQNYIITTIDAHTLDFASVEDNRANITTFRLIDPGSVNAETAVHDWKHASRSGESLEVSPDKIRTGSALMHDAVKVFSSTLRDFSLNADIELAQFDCANTSKWSQGEPILKLLDKVIRLVDKNAIISSINLIRKQ